MKLLNFSDQAKDVDPEWHEAMVNATIYIFEMYYEELVSYFKLLKNLEKIRPTNSAIPTSLPVDNKTSITISGGKSSKSHKGSNMRCHYCDKNKHNTADFKENSKCKQQEINTLL
jgi:hypothetical protein